MLREACLLFTAKCILFIGGLRWVQAYWLRITPSGLNKLPPPTGFEPNLGPNLSSRSRQSWCVLCVLGQVRVDPYPLCSRSGQRWRPRLAGHLIQLTPNNTLVLASPLVYLLITTHNTALQSQNPVTTHLKSDQLPPVDLALYNTNPDKLCRSPNLHNLICIILIRNMKAAWWLLCDWPLIVVSSPWY